MDSRDGDEGYRRRPGELEPATNGDLMPAERTIAMLDLRKQFEPLRHELERAAEDTIGSAD